MVDTKIKDLTAKTTVVATDELVINDVAGGNVDKKIGLDDTKTFMSDSPTLITPNIGTPSAGTLTSCTGLPITGITSSTSAELATLISDETGSGLLVFGTSPTLVTPALGTPASGVMTNMTGLPVAGLANGTDGELITWDSSGVAATVAVGSSGQVLTSNGTGAAPTFQAASGNTFARVVKKTDQIKNSDTTFADDDELVVAVNANKTYGYYMMLKVVGNPTPDIKIKWALPSGATGEEVSGTFSSTSPAALLDFAATTVIAFTGANQFIVKTGEIIIGGTAGNFALQWAQNVSNGANSEVKEGSFLVMWEETA